MSDTIKTRDLASLFGISVRSVNDLAQRGVISRNGAERTNAAVNVRPVNHENRATVGQGKEISEKGQDVSVADSRPSKRCVVGMTVTTFQIERGRQLRRPPFLSGGRFPRFYCPAVI
jgi:hypothetical protein